MQRRLLSLALLAGSLLGAGPALAATSNPWDALAVLRKALETQSPLRARFTQTYIPEGFKSGESEEGWFAVDLPNCLRWDYTEPYPKAFLLCGKTVYYWNQDEKVGQRYLFESEEEPGLDFFLLTIEELRVRYNAAAEPGPLGGLDIRLVPTRPTAQIVEALVRLDATHQRLEGLVYVDVEGNRTQFDIREYRTHAANDLFVPPTDMEWEEP